MTAGAAEAVFGYEAAELEQREVGDMYLVPEKDADIAKFEARMFDLPDVQVVSLTQVKNTIMTLAATARVMVLSIALIAILIAMMGVINTILMSVMERRQEIGGILEDLNRQEGLTVILVTHNPVLAARARRTIELRDGRILS